MIFLGDNALEQNRKPEDIEPTFNVIEELAQGWRLCTRITSVDEIEGEGNISC